MGKIKETLRNAVRELPSADDGMVRIELCGSPKVTEDSPIGLREGFGVISIGEDDVVDFSVQELQDLFDGEHVVFTEHLWDEEEERIYSVDHFGLSLDVSRDSSGKVLYNFLIGGV